MHQNTPFSHQKSENFQRMGHSPFPRLLPRGEGTPLRIPHSSSAPTTTKSSLRHCLRRKIAYVENNEYRRSSRSYRDMLGWTFFLDTLALQSLCCTTPCFSSSRVTECHSSVIAAAADGSLS